MVIVTQMLLLGQIWSAAAAAAACEGLCDISSSGWRVGANGAGWNRAKSFRKSILVREPQGARVPKTINVLFWPFDGTRLKHLKKKTFYDDDASYDNNGNDDDDDEIDDYDDDDDDDDDNRMPVACSPL